MKAIVVAGSAGLLGKEIVSKLQSVSEGNYVIGTDPKEHFIDLMNDQCLRGLFQEYEIIGFVNVAYPTGFEEHTKFFMHCMEQFAAKMKSGAIINIASIYGIIGPDDSLYDMTDMGMPAWYAAAKGAIIAHSRCMAVRYAPKVRINCISPGGVYDGQNPYFISKYEAKTPMIRMATPEDISGAVAFLLSEDAAYITGQNIVVDGGITARI